MLWLFGCVIELNVCSVISKETVQGVSRPIHPASFLSRLQIAINETVSQWEGSLVIYTLGKWEKS